jgi:hypothetical protein
MQYMQTHTYETNTQAQHRASTQTKQNQHNKQVPKNNIYTYKYLIYAHMRIHVGRKVTQEVQQAATVQEWVLGTMAM